MKTALMRGVCALNMEAMAAFKDTHVSAPKPLASQEITLQSVSLEKQVVKPHMDALLVPQKTFESKNVRFSQPVTKTRMNKIIVTRHQ
jgi:hypothetical protein